MTRALLLLAAVALLAQAPPPAGSPTDLYHAGAQAYIAGETAEALAAVDAGLARAPDDPKLRALRDLIDPPDDQTDEQDGGEDQEAEDTEAGDEGPEGEESDDQQRQQPPETDDGQQAERDQTDTGDPGEAQDGEAPAQPEGREPQPMTAAQAQRILDAVGSEEKLLLRELRRAPGQRPRSDKDW